MSCILTQASGKIGTRSALVSLVALSSFFPVSSATAAEPQRVPVVIARGQYRQHLQSLPIEQRPNRPLHFYGNAIRRQQARATTSPVPSRAVTPAIRSR